MVLLTISFSSLKHWAFTNLCGCLYIPCFLMSPGLLARRSAMRVSVMREATLFPGLKGKHSLDPLDTALRWEWIWHHCPSLPFHRWLLLRPEPTLSLPIIRNILNQIINALPSWSRKCVFSFFFFVWIWLWSQVTGIGHRTIWVAENSELLLPSKKVKARWFLGNRADVE